MGPPVGRHIQPKARLGLLFDGVSGHVLRLDDDGRAAGRGDEDVRTQARVSGNGLGILGAHAAAGQHGLEQAARGVVGVRLSLARHVV